MVKLKISLVVFSMLFLILITSNIQAVGTTQLLCLSKGQTVQFSKCNPNIPNWYCKSDLCKICVSYNTASKIYCPMELTKCNYLNPDVCPSLQGEITPPDNPPVNVFKVNSTTSNPTLPTTLTLPVNSSQNRAIAIQFESNEYPLNVTLYLVNSSGGFIGTKLSTIKSSSAQPLLFTIPTTLSKGTYSLKALFRSKDTSLPEVNFGQVIISSSSTSPSPETPPVVLQESSPRKSGGGGGGGSSSKKVANQTAQNKTLVSNEISNSNSTIHLNPPVQTAINQTNSSPEFSPSPITGSAIGSSNFPQKSTLVLIASFLAVIFAAFIVIKFKPNQKLTVPKKLIKKSK